MPKQDIEQLRRKLLKKAKEQVREKYTGKDVHIIRGIAVLQDLDGVFNLLAENCREWYSIYFPELNRTVRDNEAFLKMVYFLGERKNFTEKKIVQHFENKEAAKKIAAAAKEGMGSPVETPTLKEIQLLAANALNLREERIYLEKFLDVEMSAIAWNFSQLAGTTLGAKLLAATGSLRKLAMLPASTIQILGAEKALFRHMRNKSIKGPKYGFLYQHPMVKKMPAKHKGKFARTLAGKLSIAARADYFGKQKIAAKLRKGLEQRAEQLLKD